MACEIAQIPQAAQRLCEKDAQDQFRDAGKRLQKLNPACFVTIARGSSDHAATCLKYAIELVAGVPVASLGPSIASIYAASLKMDRIAAIAISQSGGSQDLVKLSDAVRSGGGQVLALTNTSSSPLAQSATQVLDVLAGPENAIAATKSYTNSVLSGLWLVAHWQDNTALMNRLGAMPEQLEQAMAADITALVTELSSVDRLIVLGRGPSLGVAQEVALKAMEVCAIPAAAYSSAEVLHGPSAILKDGYPVLGIGATALNGITETLDRLKGQGARILTPVSGDLKGHDTMPALEELVCLYRAMEAVSRGKGMDPDRPENLSKITDTV